MKNDEKYDEKYDTDDAAHCTTALRPFGLEFTPP